MQMTNIYEAKTHFSALINEVVHGKEIIIGKSGTPVAKIVPYKSKVTTRKPGVWRGKVKIAEDFDELPKGLLAAFNGEEDH